MTVSTQHLLTDVDVAQFIVTGHHLVEPDLAAGLNDTIAGKLDRLESNPGDAIADAVPELWQVLDPPAVKGVLISLLGPGYEVKGHRHWHCKEPDSGHMQWHQDSTNKQGYPPEPISGFVLPAGYYPRYGPDGDSARHAIPQRSHRPHGDLH